MIRVGYNSGFTLAEAQKLYKAVDVVNALTVLKEFHDELSAHRRFNGTLGFEGSDDSGDTIYKRLVLEDASLRLSIRSYPWWQPWKRIEVAHENADGSIVFNRRHFSKQSLGSLANTLTHEFLHNLGYHHDYKRTSRRPYSVPYAVGAIVEKLFAQGVLNKTPAPTEPEPAPAA